MTGAKIEIGGMTETIENIDRDQETGGAIGPAHRRSRPNGGKEATPQKETAGGIKRGAEMEQEIEDTRNEAEVEIETDIDRDGVSLCGLFQP